MKTKKKTLDELLRSYPGGGIPGLAADAGIGVSTLYAFVSRKHRKTPWRIIHAILDAQAGLVDVCWIGAPDRSDGWALLWSTLYARY